MSSYTLLYFSWELYICNTSKRRSSLSGAPTFASAHVLIFFLELCDEYFAGCGCSWLAVVFSKHFTFTLQPPHYEPFCALYVAISMSAFLLVDKVTFIPLHTSASFRYQRLRLLHMFLPNPMIQCGVENRHVWGASKSKRRTYSVACAI